MSGSELVSMLAEEAVVTLYMTIFSTALGYLFGLPMGVLLTISDKEGLKPNTVLYKILDVIANIVRSVPFFDPFDPAHTLYQVCCGQILRIYGYRGFSDRGGHTLYRAYGRVFPEGSGRRCH